MNITSFAEFSFPFAEAIFITFASFFFLTTIRRRILNMIAAKEDQSNINSIIIKQLFESTNLLFIALFSLFFGSLYVDLGDKIELLIKKAAFISLILLLGMWANVAINHAIFFIGEHYQHKKGMSSAVFAMLKTLCKVAIWMTLGLFILDNLNFQISTLIAGLGIGGIALALAVQNILQDLFASLSIIIDEPFLIGDLVGIDQHKGTIEYIGIKTTRVRSLDGEQIIFSNADLLKTRLRNFKKMEERRVTVLLGVTYETSIETIKAIPPLLKEIISKTKKVRFERAHLKNLGDYAVNFEAVYYVLSPSTSTYMDIQQEINEGILENFAQANIEFAYPTAKSICVEQK